MFRCPDSPLLRVAPLPTADLHPPGLAVKDEPDLALTVQDASQLQPARGLVVKDAGRGVKEPAALTSTERIERAHLKSSLTLPVRQHNLMRSAEHKRPAADRLGLVVHLRTT